MNALYRTILGIGLVMPLAGAGPFEAPAWMNEPYHPGGGSRTTACVRYITNTAPAGQPVDKIVDMAVFSCEIDRALARVIVLDELGSRNQ